MNSKNVENGIIIDCASTLKYYPGGNFIQIQISTIYKYKYQLCTNKNTNIKYTKYNYIRIQIQISTLMYWDEVILVAGVGLFCTTGNTGTPHQIQIQIQYKYHCTHVFRNINTNEMQDKNKYNNRQKSMVFYTEFPTVDMRSH